jgi:hypothetical protein
MSMKAIIMHKKISENQNKMQDFIDRYQSYYDNLDETLKLQILRSKAYEIHKNICEKKLFTSTIVVIVFCFASMRSNNTTNCLTEIMFDQAISRAKELDQYFAKNQKPIGPLHGIPFSIKDTFDIENFGTYLFLALIEFF